LSISQKTVFYDSAALLDVGLQYTFKWVELWMDDKGVSFSDYEQIIGNLDASQVAVSAGISCLAATFPFVPSSKKKLIVALIAGLGDGAYAMVDDIYNQYDELSKKDPKASIKTIFEKLSWKQALTAGGSNFLITTISTGVVLYAKSNPKFVDFAQKLEAKIKKQGTVFLERAGLNKEAVETLLRKLGIKGVRRITRENLLTKLASYPNLRTWINRLDNNLDADLLGRINKLSSSQLEGLNGLYRNMPSPKTSNIVSVEPTGAFTASINGIEVHYDKNGFPNFEPYSPGKNYSIKSDDLIGRSPNPGPQNLHPDFEKANTELISRYGANNVLVLHPTGSPIRININGVWQGPFTWHHHQDGKTMMPVIQSVHSVFVHSGGADIITRQLQELFQSPF
jgi:hypothetical protein